MKIPNTVIGFAIFVAGREILSALHIRHLRKASKNISCDDSTEIVLRYGVWMYIIPTLGFIGCLAFAWGAITEINSFRHIAYYIFSALCLAVAIWLWRYQSKAFIRLHAGQLSYIDGNKIDFSDTDVESVTMRGFYFLVGLKQKKTIQIPSTFSHSEIILSFLNRNLKNENPGA